MAVSTRLTGGIIQDARPSLGVTNKVKEATGVLVKPRPDSQPGNQTGSGAGYQSYTAPDYSGLISSMQSMYAEQRAYAEELARKKQAAAQAAYDRNMAALRDAYDRRGTLLRDNYDSTLGQLQAQYDYGAGKVSDNAARADQQAYINYMMSKRDMPQQLAALGINGGASESRLAGLYNSYGNARNQIDTGRNSDLADLLRTLDQNKASALQNYNKALSDDDAARLAYQMQLEQNLANQNADILTAQYDQLGSLSSDYLGRMLDLQTAQAQAAAKAASSAYSASNATAGSKEEMQQAYESDLADVRLGNVSLQQVVSRMSKLRDLYGEDKAHRILEAAVKQTPNRIT